MINSINKLEWNDGLTPYGALFLRWTLALYWGVHFFYKVFYQGMDVTQALFVKLGFAPWLAYGDVLLEAAAIISLVLGVYVRTASALLLLILLPALKLWIPNGLWAIHGGYEFPVLWCLLQVTQMLLGPGKFALRTFRPLSMRP